eukprot:2645121-Rhodomonas_salina.1
MYRSQALARYRRMTLIQFRSVLGGAGTHFVYLFVAWYELCAERRKCGTISGSCGTLQLDGSFVLVPVSYTHLRAHETEADL